MNEKTNKVVYIILSLLFAIIFWKYVDDEQGNMITQDFNDIPVEFIGETDTLPNRGLMLVEGGDTTVDLKLSGSRTIITSLRKEDIHLQVDLTNITSSGTYPVSYKLVMQDSGVSISQASISTFMVTIAEMYEKTVPVEVRVVGEIAEGYIYMEDKLEIQPSVLTVRGREEDVDEVDAALVLVDLSGASTTVQKEFDYQLVDRDENAIETESLLISDKRVEVTAPVYVTKELDLTVKWKEAPGSRLEDVAWRLEPSTINVAGEAISLENKLDIVLAEVDLSTLLSDTEVELPINLPSGCVNLSGYTTTTLSISFNSDLATRTFTVTNISAIGVGEGLSFSRVTQSVDVMLRGPAEILEQVTEDDIRIVVNLEDKVASGTYSVTATVLVDGIGSDKVGAAGTYSVNCKLASS